MSTKNGNGDKPTPLEAVEERIAARLATEHVSETLHHVGSSEHPPGVEEEPISSVDADPLTAWKRRVPGKPVTLEQIHDGLIATCEYSEAAIEGGLKMASEVHEVAQTVEHHSQQIAVMTAKVESTSAFVHKVDEELATNSKLLVEVRKDVQFLKDDMREVKEISRLSSRQLPAIKDMLGEILARLPEPEKKPA
jgi:hypothetical protein